MHGRKKRQENQVCNLSSKNVTSIVFCACVCIIKLRLCAEIFSIAALAVSPTNRKKPTGECRRRFTILIDIFN